MVGFGTATWLTLAAVHLAVIIRAILLPGREPYARAAWLLLLMALPGIGTLLYLLFGEPWVSPAFRQRARDAYQALLPYAVQASSEQPRVASRNAFRTCEAASQYPLSMG